MHIIIIAKLDINYTESMSVKDILLSKNKCHHTCALSNIHEKFMNYTTVSNARSHQSYSHYA